MAAPQQITKCQVRKRKEKASSGVYQILIFTRIKKHDNIQSSHGNIGDASSDSMNLRDNLALLIDKCQRPAFSRLFFCNREKSHTSSDTF